MPETLPLLLTDKQIDSVTDFINHLYRWASKREPNNSQQLAKEYEKNIELLLKSDVNVEHILLTADPNSGLMNKFYDVMYELGMEKQDWLTGRNYNPVMPADTFEEGLNRFRAKTVNISREYGDGASWMDIRNAIKSDIEKSIHSEAAVNAAYSDALISRYEHTHSMANLSFIQAIADHPNRYEFIHDKDIKHALDDFTAVTAWKQSGETEGKQLFFESYLREQEKPVGKGLLNEAPLDALNRLDEVLIAKGIGDAVKTEIIRRLEKIALGEDKSNAVGI